MGKSLQAASDYSQYTAFPQLGLSPVVFHIGSFDLRWYSLAYIAGIFIGYWYLLKLLRQPGAPMARRHADDLAFYAALGIMKTGSGAGLKWRDRQAAEDYRASRWITLRLPPSAWASLRYSLAIRVEGRSC